MDTEYIVVKVRGGEVELGRGGQKWGKWETSVIVSTIKKIKERIEMSGLTNFWRLTLSETISDFRIFSLSSPFN